MIIGLIPARSGSKRLKNKNILNFSGKPLLEWTSIAAKKSILKQTFLSTDDKRIAKIGEKIGLNVPFLRPKNISKNNTGMIKVLVHFVKWLEQNNYKPSAIVILQPTSPLRKYFHINQAINLFKKNKPDSVVSVSDIPENFGLGKYMHQNNKGLLKEFNFKKGNLVIRNGPSIIVTNIKNIKNNNIYGKKILSYKMNIKDSIDINDEFDFKIAEYIHSNL